MHPTGWNPVRAAAFAVALLILCFAVAAPAVHADDGTGDTGVVEPAASPDPASLTWDELLAEIEYRLDIVDLPRARRLARSAIRRQPLLPGGYEALGRLYAMQSRWDEAEAAFTRAFGLSLDSFHGALGLAMVADFRRDYDTARKWALIARHIAPERFEGTAVAGRVAFKSGDMDESARLFWLTQDLANLEVHGHVYPGNGFVSVSEPIDTDAIEADGDPVARSAYRAARQAFIDGQVTDARQLALLARRRDPTYFGGAFVLGLLAQRAGDLDSAISHLMEAARLGRGHPLVHNALAVSLAQRELRHEAVESWPEYRELQAAMPGDFDVPGIEKLIPRYPAMTPETQAACRRAVGPFRRHIARVTSRRAVHDIMTLAESIIHHPARKWLKGRRTMDQRRYDDVRGVGGRVAATSIEDVQQAIDCQFNTLAHEFAHQVHEYAMTANQKREIKRLYEAAKAGGHCLDYYAAHNEFEYFAQGYEAYVSLFKRPASGLTARHTRFELMQVDPDLFAFIESVADASVLEDPAWDAAIDAARRCLRRDGRAAEAVSAEQWLVQRRDRRDAERATEPR